MTNLFVTISILLAISVTAGHETGNGTGEVQFSTKDSAWYTRRWDQPLEPIQVCYEVGESMDEYIQNPKDLITNTFTLWEKYLKSEAQIGNNEYCGNRLWGLCIVDKINVKGSCDGSEELKILFGTDPKGFEDIVKKRRRVGLALRQHFDLASKRSKGIIWIAPQNYHRVFSGPELPNWRHEKAVDLVLLHEMGHVFGVGHVPGTVMEEDVYGKFTSGGLFEVEYATRIDWDRHLINPEFGKLEYQVNAYATTKWTAHDQMRRVFKMLTGVKKIGKYDHEKLIISLSKEVPFGWYVSRDPKNRTIVDLDYKANGKSYNFKVELIDWLSSTKIGERVFYRFGNPNYGVFTKGEGMVFFGRIKDSFGRYHHVHIFHNIEHQLEIQLWDEKNSTQMSLFTSKRRGDIR